jgi:hypothetical protein
MRETLVSSSAFWSWRFGKYTRDREAWRSAGVWSKAVGSVSISFIACMSIA